jgi:fructokinase
MRILCVGEALVDLVCERPVSSVGEADAFVPHVGGTGAAVAVFAARRGADAALAGRVGADPWGEWLVDRLDREGVALTWLDASAEGAATPVAFVTVDGAGAATGFGYGAADGLASLDEAVDACDALFLSSNALVAEEARGVVVAARDRALRAGKPVILDPDIRWERWRSRSAAVEVIGPLVEGAFLVTCDAGEALALTGELEVERAARSLVAAGAGHVVVRLGDDDGALLRGGGLDRDVRGVAAARVVDRSGAGAAVSGVLLAALARTGFYPASIAAMLPDALAEAARVAERYGSVGP